MQRTLGVAGVLVALVLGLTGCGGQDDPDDDRPSASGSTSSPTTGTEVASTVTPEADGTATDAGLSRGAATDDFCAALEEIDDAIDEAETGDDDDWLRIVAAFDALYETGVPDDLPAAGVAELDQVDILVRQSDSVEEFGAAADAARPSGGAIDDYIDHHCG